MVCGLFKKGRPPHPQLPFQSPQRWPDLSVKKTLLILLVCLALGHWHASHSEAAEVAVRLNAFFEGGVIVKKVKSMRELRRRQMVPQSADYSCGAAALATVLRYHFGQQMTEKDAILGMFKHGEQEKIRRRGFSLLDMKRFALKQGLQAKGYRVEEITALQKVNVPVITLIETNRYKHFVVIRRTDDRYVYLSDPSWGNRRILLGDFQKYWNRAILVLFGPCQGTPEGLYREAVDEFLPKHEAIRYESLLGHRFALDPANTMLYFTQFPDRTSIPVLIQPVVGFLSGN
jgi:predicted double-glycine peptidase